MPSIFTRIIKGEIPCYKVAEDERFIAFLDINPVHEGHTLVVPKVEVDKFFELPEEVLAAYLPFARSVADRVKRVVPCDRVGITVIGLEVPHAHMHLIPINSMRDMDFTQPKVKFSPEEFKALAERILKA